MPHHPSLKEVIDKEDSYEWMPLRISGFFLGDFANSENMKGTVSSPQFILYSSASRSEYGTYEFNGSAINVVLGVESEIQNLEGKFPLGSVNYYDDEKAHINLVISEKIYSNLFTLITHDIDKLEISIAIPQWEDTSAKCLPVAKYQVIYKDKNEI